MLDKPVFRSPQGCIDNNSKKAWTYSSCHRAVQNLAFRAGYRYPITSYFIRRMVADTLYGTYTLYLTYPLL